MVEIAGQKVTFSFYRPEAREVFLAGDFNHWQERQIRLKPGDSGLWTVRLMLRPGRYEFRYWADGEWYTDFSAFGVEPGRFGLNSVLVVPEQPVKIITPPAASFGRRHTAGLDLQNVSM